MARMKRITKEKLEEHVLYWFDDQMCSLREMVHKVNSDCSIPDDELPFILEGLANNAVLLLELIDPLEHDYDSHIDWAKEFIEYHASELSLN